MIGGMRGIDIVILLLAFTGRLGTSACYSDTTMQSFLL